MARAVLDANVLISAILSPRGATAQLLVAWQSGAFDMVISPLLLVELRRALTYPKLAKRVPAEDADAFVSWLSGAAELVADPGGDPPVRSVDPGDDYLIALAAAARAALVSGDAHLTSLADRSPIRTPTGFLEDLGLSRS